MMAATVIIAMLSKVNVDSNAEQNFSDAVTAAINETNKQIDRTFVELRAIQGLFNASEFVTSDEFAIFTRGFLDREKGVQALEWIPRVPRDERASYESQIQEQDGYSDYAIHPEGDRGAYFPVGYINPLEPNILALGYDLASNPTRLLALENARDTGELTATEPIILAQESEAQLAFLVFAPIYSSKSIPLTMLQRRDTLEGFALAVIRFGAFLSDAIPSLISSEIDIEVRDSESEAILFSSTHQVPWSSDRDLLTATRELSVANETWDVKFVGPHDYGVQGLGQELWIAVLVVGSVLSFSLTGLVLALFRSQQSALALSEERRQSHEAEAAANAELAQLIETANVPIIGVDLNKDVNIWNQASASATGYRASEILGNALMSVVLEDQRSALDAEMSKVLDGEFGYDFECHLKAKDGNRVVLVFNSSPRWSATGEIVGAIGVGIDVTEQNKLREQLLQSDKLASIGTLVSGVAHEINNPLTGTLIQAQLLLRKENDETTRQSLEMIKTETERAAKIVQNLLSFARQGTPQRQNGNVNEIIHRVINLRAYDLRLHNILVTMELAPDLPDIMVDDGQLQQVFLNLVNNAEHAMLEANGKGHIRIQSAQVGNKIQIVVADDGPGIPREVLSRVFDPFFTTKETGKGTGLGLSISYGIIKEHGGEIKVQSQFGEGTTFIVELPVEQEPMVDRRISE